MADKKINLKESLSKLNGIVEWFDEQEEVDVEVGLEKVKEGAELIRDCKKDCQKLRMNLRKYREI